MLTSPLMADPIDQNYHDRLSSALSGVSGLPQDFTQNLFTEQDTKLIPLISSLLASHGSSLSEEKRAEVAKIKADLIKALRQFKVTGCAFAADPNLAFLYNNQNPTFTMMYSNPKGELKTRTFETSIKSLGLKFELSIRLDCILFIGEHLNFLDTDKRIELGAGIDISLDIGSGIGFVYVPFLNAPGGILILSLPIGIGGGISLVTGGYLQPINS